MPKLPEEIEVHQLDNVPLDPNREPFRQERSDWLGRLQRTSSGGLEDDPTESGEPVRDRKSFVTK